MANPRVLATPRAGLALSLCAIDHGAIVVHIWHIRFATRKAHSQRRGKLRRAPLKELAHVAAREDEGTALLVVSAVRDDNLVRARWHSEPARKAPQVEWQRARDGKDCKRRARRECVESGTSSMASASRACCALIHSINLASRWRLRRFSEETVGPIPQESIHC